MTTSGAGRAGQRAVARLAGRTHAVVAAPEPPGDDVAKLLATLPPQQRIAAALFYVEQLTVREIADSMKLSEGAVKYHLHAARRDVARPPGGVVSDDLGFEPVDDEVGRRLRGAAPPRATPTRRWRLSGPGSSGPAGAGRSDWSRRVRSPRRRPSSWSRSWSGGPGAAR